MSKDPFERAVDPKQYDLSDIDWTPQVREGSVRNEMIVEFLERYLPSWKGKRVLDIGSGTGWLLDVAKHAGATRVVGIEPSERHAALSQEHFPQVEVHHQSFDEFVPSPDHRFERELSIWALPHMRDVDGFFKKAAGMLENEGELIIIVPDYAYYKVPRHGYEVIVEEIDADSYATSVTRPDQGTIADVVRKNSVYLEAAKRAGLSLREEVPMRPSDRFVEKNPKYKEYYNTPMSQLLRFKKES